MGHRVEGMSTTTSGVMLYDAAMGQSECEGKGRTCKYVTVS